MKESRRMAITTLPLDRAVPAIRSFPPIQDRHARVLVLGSMPGAASLLAGRYYEYKHNAFWKIMGELFGAGPDVAYAKRVVLLKRSGLAVWDVLESCVREGSLDSAIDEISIVPNDFRKFFASHPRIGHVFFNGGMAETSFRRYVRPHLPETGIRFARLPSTSPAHAARNFETKLKAWRAVAEALKKLTPTKAGVSLMKRN
jgi:hypoxanthine-DNA glycosylase